MSYSNFLNKDVFSPLGMRNTKVYSNRRSNKEKIMNIANDYVYSFEKKNFVIPDNLSELKNVFYLDGITGDGSIYTSISDLILWEKALRENKLVSEETLNKSYLSYKLINGSKTNYGYGVQIADGKEKVIYHSGGWGGYHTFMTIFPK